MPSRLSVHVHSSRVLPAVFLLFSVAFAPGTRAENSNLVLSNDNGASIEFVSDDTGWRLTRLTTPITPDGRAIVEERGTISAGTGTDTLSTAWQLVANEPKRLVFEQAVSNSGLGVRRIFSFGPAYNVLRVETWVRSLEGAKLLNRVGLLSLSVDEQAFRTMGPSPSSFPVFGQALFAGIEDICGESRADGATFRLWQTPDLSVAEGWQFVAAVVVGWHVSRAAPFLPGESRTREAFLQYLDTIRVVPEDINLHSDTWWTLPLPLTETDVVRDIDSLQKAFFDRTGLFFNTYALDLGWSDPHTLWGIDTRNFPNGLGAINQRLSALGCKMGMWVSPSSGYAPGLDNHWLEAQGYEVTPVGDDEKVACFALGGRYQREFTDTLVRYAKEYSLGHVIFDGLVHSCDDPTHQHATGVGSVYSIDAGFRDVMTRLRQVNPRMILEPLSCGHPPSPWWNMYTPFLLAPAGDDVPYGRVPCPDWTESLISARDIAYRAGQENWLVRTQALETFDIIVQSPGTFENLAVMAAGRGRWFMSANLKPELMKPSDWDFLAGLVRWQRANKQDLVDARIIGGRPDQREAYGYMFHHADRDFYCIRNPWIEERTIRLPARLSEARDVRMIYPRRSRVARIQPEDDGTDIVLGPYETMFLETVAIDDNPASFIADTPAASIEGEAVEAISEPQKDSDKGINYQWRATVVVPDVTNADLCVLVEGAPGIEGTQGTLMIDGRVVNAARKASAGHFGAAVDPSPENWSWLLGGLAPGKHRVEITLAVPLQTAAVGIFLKGSLPATSDPAPEDDVAPFPLYQPDQRPWSRTLRAIKRLGRGAEAEIAAASL